MGTPDFSVGTLKALHGAGHQIVACYSQPPRPAGRRGLDLVPSPVQTAAEELGIPVLTPTSLKTTEEQERFRQHQADVAVVVAYGLLLPKPILDAPKHGCFNGHASLLPRWRGAAPIQRAIMAGDDETGIMVMKMEEGLDTGPIAMTTKLPIDSGTTAALLHDQLADAGAQLMVRAMQALEDGALTLTPQSEEGVVYAKKIDKAEARINWSRPAEEVHRHIMGLSPFPGAWCEMHLSGKATRVKVLESEVVSAASGTPGTVISDNLEIACATGSIRLLRVQKAGSKPAQAQEFLRGNPVEVGAIIP